MRWLVSILNMTHSMLRRENQEDGAWEVKGVV